MKKKVLSYTVLLLLVLSLFNFPVKAAEYPLWSSSQETKNITVYRDTSTIFSYVPNRTGEYAIKYKITDRHELSRGIRPKENGALNMYGNYSKGEYEYEVYTLTAGKEYILRFDASILSSYSSRTFEVSIIKWDDKMLIPDCPYIKENEKAPVKVSSGEVTTSFLFAPSSSGQYCFGVDNQKIGIIVDAVRTSLKEFAPIIDHKDHWMNDTQCGELYNLESGRVYAIAFSSSSSRTESGNFWVRKGNPPQNDYETWDISKEKTILSNGKKSKKFYLDVQKSGKYMLVHDPNVRSIQLTNSNHDRMEYPEFSAHAYLTGNIFNLKAGEEYVLEVEFYINSGESATMKFEKVGPVKSASLFLINYAKNGGCTLGLDVNPICGGYYEEGVKWSVSDSSVATIKESYNSSTTLKFLKQGKVTVTAKIGDVTASYTLTTDMKPPILKEGETTDTWCSFEPYSVVATINPAKTGKYQFTVIPQKLHKYHVPNISFGISPSNDIAHTSVYNVDNVSDKQVVTVNLKKGQEYSLYSLGGRFSVYYKYMGNASSDGSNGSHTNSGNNSSPNINSTDNTDKIDGVVVPVIPATPTEPGKVIIDTSSLQEAISTGSNIRVDFSKDLFVELDKDIISSLIDATVGEGISVVAENRKLSDLNEKQQKALEGKEPTQILDLTMAVDGKPMHQLGGKARVTMANPDKNINWEVLYLAEDGTVETMEAICGESITFYTSHFSYYALVANGTKSASSNGWILYVALALVVLAGGVTLFFVLKKKKSAKNE